MNRRSLLTKLSSFTILWLGLLFITQNSVAQIIIYPKTGSQQEQIAAREVRRYVYTRTDQKLQLKQLDTLPGKGDLIVVADYYSRMVQHYQDQLLDVPPEGGFIIKTVSRGSRNVLIITGSNALSTLYGAYRFAEHLGVGFRLMADVVPDKKIGLDITGFDEKGKPLLETRGILPFHDFPAGPDLWDTDEYKKVISQLPKLGMNFFGLHNYHRWSGLRDRAENIPQGPEPAVWIGSEEDINPDGTVKWSYPAYWAHTHRPGRIWGYARWDTDRFHAGAAQLFDSNGFGSDVIGENVPTDLKTSNQVFDRAGRLFDKAFTHAGHLGVKTALGTELPLGLEPEGPEVKHDWIRGLPPKLQERLRRKGKDLTKLSTVREIYRGIFRRIKRAHPLDYYWLWTWEGWARWSGSKKQIARIEDEMQIARQALQQVDAPFRLALGGWMIGTQDDPDLFDNSLPPEVPYLGLWDKALGFEELKPERVKWPASWLEEDWGLVQPQLEAARVYDDTKAAVDKQCHGLIAKHWRTRILGMNIAAMKDMLWVYGKTGEALEEDIPKNKTGWLENFYRDWAARQFGPNVAGAAAEIFIKYEKDGNKLPQISEWDTDLEQNGAPGAIMANEQPWSSEKTKYEFVDEWERLQSQVVGAGNHERFEYWLHVFESYRLKARYGCVRHQFRSAAENDSWSEALEHRKKMARLFEKIMHHEIQKSSNVSDLGEIITLEILNWHQLMELKWDDPMEKGLGREIPSDANPSPEYKGDPMIQVDAAPGMLYKEESFHLTVRVVGDPETVVLKYRALGEDRYQTRKLNHVARGVYSINLPPRQEDFEYYLRAETDKGKALYPASAKKSNKTVIVIDKTLK